MIIILISIAEQNLNKKVLNRMTLVLICFLQEIIILIKYNYIYTNAYLHKNFYNIYSKLTHLIKCNYVF